jgi:hypothetical protein
MEGLTAHHIVIAPDYPPVNTIAEFITAFDIILEAENVSIFYACWSVGSVLIGLIYLINF